MAAGHLAWDSVGLADLVPLVASLHGDDGELGQGDGRMEGSGYLLAAFNTQTNASTGISNGNKRLEPGPLARWGLLLHRQNLQNLVSEGGPQENVNDSHSLVSREKREISSRDLIMSLTGWPSLVKAIPFLFSALPPGAPSVASAGPHKGGDPRQGCCCPRLRWEPRRLPFQGPAAAPVIHLVFSQRGRQVCHF